MARNAQLQMGFAGLPVKVVNAVKSDDDEESELKTLCTGNGTILTPAEAKAQKLTPKALAEKGFIKRGKDWVHEHAPHRVNQIMRCSISTCGREESSHWKYAKGHDNGDGTFTVLTAEQLASTGAPEDVKNTITITVHKRDDVERSTIRSGRVYYLDLRSDGRHDMENYEAIRDAVDRHSSTYAFCTVFAIQSKPAMYEIVRRGDVLLLEELAWPMKVNQPPVILPVPYDERLNAWLDNFVSGLVDDFDPATFSDSRRAKIAAFLRENGAVEAADGMEVAAPEAANPMVAAFLAQQQAVAAAEPKATPKKRAKKITEESVPSQPLPENVPENVDTTLVATAPALARAKKSA